MNEQHKARQLAEDGIQRAVDHADRKKKNWSALAYMSFLYYAKYHKTFQTEDVRRWAEHLPSPPDNRAWGAITRRAVKAGIIKRVGYAPVKSPNCHMAPMAVWESQIYQEPESDNQMKLFDQ